MMQKLRFNTANLIQFFNPAFLVGFTFSDLIRLLIKLKWKIDPIYIPRAGIALLGSICTSILSIFEPKIECDDQSLRLSESPIFILGLARSGTTHLYHLLSRDPQFAFLTKMDCYNPHTFLTLRRIKLDRLLNLLPARARAMDNVKTNLLSPEEDVNALFILSGEGSRLHQTFPRSIPYGSTSKRFEENAEYFKKYLAALKFLSLKLVKLHGRRPIFKSPSHSTITSALLDAFPSATFITILRNPISQFKSLSGLHNSNLKTWACLQEGQVISDNDRLKLISLSLQRYIDCKHHIPNERLIEIHYEELVEDQAKTLQKIYLFLGLEMPEEVKKTPAPYVRNQHNELDRDLILQIQQAYEPFIKAGLFQDSEIIW